MTLENHLKEFYTANNIPVNGGADDTSFKMKFGVLELTLPNPEFRRKVTYIHDLQHVLYNCDTSWKGEGFIAGWEIATGMWKHFPVNLLSLWAMGYSLWCSPKVVFNGFMKGRLNNGIIDLNYTKEELLKKTKEELSRLIEKSSKKSTLVQTLEFIFWSFISQLVFLFPAFIIVFILIKVFL